MKTALHIATILIWTHLVTLGGQVFGHEYDEVWYVRFNYIKANSRDPGIFEKDGTPRDTIEAAIRVEWNEENKMIESLFKNKESFEDSGVDDCGLILDGLVFYKNNSVVFTILPNHAGRDVWTEPKIGYGGQYSFSDKQMARYDELMKVVMERSLPIQTPRKLPKKNV